MNNKHTPGPWKVATRYGSHTADIVPWATQRQRVARLKVRPDYQLSQMIFDARLIAESPAMKDTLVDLIRLWDDWGSESQFIAEPLRRSLEMRVEQARAILARIEGR